MPKDLLTAAWKLLLLRGVIGIVLGIVLIAWPQATIVVLMVLIGIWALIDGIGLAAQVFAKGAGTGQRVLFGVMALVALVVALFAIFRPGVAASAVTWFIGIWLLVRGLFELVGAFSSTITAPRWLLVAQRPARPRARLAVRGQPGNRRRGRGGRHRHPRHRLGRRLRGAGPGGPQRHQGPPGRREQPAAGDPADRVGLSTDLAAVHRGPYAVT